MSSPVARKLAAADARRIAAARAAHAAAVSRRRAAAGRRRLLLGVLIAATAALVVAGIVSAAFPLWPAAIPAMLAGGVVYLGITANAGARAADERWEAELEQIQRPLARRTRTEAATPAGHGTFRMDVDPAALLGETTESAAPEASTWTPVPVPAPTYTMKAAAPRRTVAPYEAKAEEAPAATALVTSAPVTSAPSAASPETPERKVDVREVLARRRAAG